MASYDHDGLRLHYEAVGSGPTILCVHGATGTGEFEWGRLAGPLQDRYRLVMPDLRGHGRSDTRQGHLALELIQEDLRALIEVEDLGRPHFLGFSFGSEVALRLELAHPGTARSLVLLSPGLGEVKPGVNAKAAMPGREQLEKVWPKALRDLHAERHGADHWVEIMQELWVRHAERPLIPLEALEPIACPILLICGSDDAPRRLEQSRLFADVNPRVQLVEVPDAGHPVHLNQPGRVEQIVADFLDAITEHEGASSDASRAEMGDDR
jgi:pimeloyl-ACP methyl ester carboxylesterase